MIGAITPAILVILLRPYGYEVTERCLTDWRYKGDLPQLEKISRGFRKGILRCWKQKDILAVALDICRRRKDAGRKRMYGVVYRNWLSGARVPATRAQNAWVKELNRTAYIPKSVRQRCAMELSAFTALTPGSVRDILDEILRIVFEPGCAIGEAQHIVHMHRLVQRVIRGFCKGGELIVVGEKSLLELLRWFNAYLSPAAMRSLVASATAAELHHARDAYLHWWRGLDRIWAAMMAIGNVENSSLMPLAHSLAPFFVPLLLSSRSDVARLEPAQFA